MANKVEPKTLAELEKMHTGTLMTRRKALLKCDESFEVSNQTKPSNSGMIEFKNTPEWKKAYQDLKTVLDTRENLPNKQQRKAMRQAKAKARK
ncbi:hypothetical protein [Marinicella gelatinilytica]|uniref:hypothetical protein n=1 Tax=Marinicella gelatinilytica TaxID=2996017 RepID=UPI002260D5B0|nr:hypothetical protein [Marinicella gelatinilytica]MCX7545487.1 hypothetical protein [Marinicella gelatinilytica]